MDHETVEAGTILVVDDVDDIRELYVHCFTEAGFTVEAAADGAQAAALAASGKFDAIVMDLQMPTMDGLEAARAIRASRGERPYLLAVSAHVADINRREAYDAGFDRMVTKPITPAVLIAIVRAALRLRRTAGPEATPPRDGPDDWMMVPTEGFEPS